MTAFDLWVNGLMAEEGHGKQVDEEEEESPLSSKDDLAKALIAHINKLYNIIDGGSSEIAETPQLQTRSWYNPGHSSVTESA